MQRLCDSTLKANQRLETEAREEQQEKPRNVNISMYPSFLEKLDDAVEESGFSSRSKFVREKLRKEVSDK